MPTKVEHTRANYQSCRAPHSLDDIVGYEVWQTLAKDGTVIDGGRLVTVIDGAGRYLDALDIAHSFRSRWEGERFVERKSYAVVCSVFRCGHSWADWDNRPRPAVPLTDRSRCGIHGEPTVTGRCAACDAESGASR